MALVRWDPFREMWSLRSMMDRMMDRWLEPSWSLTTGWQPDNWDLALDVAETEDNFVVKASLPGMNPDDLEITYNNNLLTIKGEMKAEREVDEQRYHLRERRTGSFSRNIALPSTVDADHIQASYNDGVLTLHLPWDAVYLTLISGILVAVVAGWVPARRAAQLEIREALEYE